MECNQRALSKTESAEKRVMSKGTQAAAKLLSLIKAQGKTGARTEPILGKFFEALGGEEQYAEMMADDFKLARGEGLSQEDLEAWGYSPKLVAQWHEIIMRYTDRSDQNKTLSVDGLEEAELESILSGLGQRMVLEDKALQQTVVRACLSDAAFRQEVFYEIVRSDSKLVDKLLQSGGIITLEEKKDPSATLSSQQEFDPDYDPSEDEIDD